MYKNLVEMLIESSADGILAFDRDCRYTLWNPAMERLSGLSAAEVLGRCAFEVFPFLRETGEDRYFHLALEGKSPTATDRAFIIPQTGHRGFFEARYAPLQDDAGEITGGLGIIRDITERKLAEEEHAALIREQAARREAETAERRFLEELQESEKRFRQLAENIDEVFWLTDPSSSEIIYISPVYERIWGRSRESLYAAPQSFLEAVHPDDRERVRAALPQRLAGTYQQEYRVVRPDGSVRWVWARAFPIRDESGRVTRIAGIADDITERKLIEADIREQREVVETVNRIGQILSAELDLQRLVQAVTDAATELTGARYGSLFYNVLDERGATHTLYTLSGLPREVFAHFPTERAAELLGSAFRGRSVLRIGDINRDPRYGESSPYYGMLEGQAPVTSYLAVPVISRSGEVLGGLFFGHPEAGVFSEYSERLVAGLAAQAAIAMDNARLYEAARRERVLLEESEKRYRSLADAMPQIVWTARADGHFDYYNRRWFEYTGLTEEESFAAEGWRAVLHPEDVEVCRERWYKSIRTGEEFKSELRFKRASDSSYRWHLGRALPMRDREGRVLKWFGTSTDIDDQKRAEEHLRFVVEASEILSESLDYESTLSSVAHLAVPQLADWCAVDMLEQGQSFRRLAVAHTDPAKIELAMEIERRYPTDMNAPHGLPAVLRTGKPEFLSEITDAVLVETAEDEEHLSLMRRLGLKSYMVVPLIARGRTLGALTFVTAESGRPYTEADLSFAEDLARRAALAVDNARLYREAQEANRTKDEFLATVSHELRTPLTAVLGWARILRTGSIDEATTQRALETIERNANAQAQLVGDLLDVSRIITGKLRLDVRPIDLKSVIDQAVEAIRPAAEARGIHLQVIADPLAGPVSGDPDRLQQVVWNLLANAVKFTPRDGRVEVRLERNDSYVSIIVSDTGMGIRPDFLPFVFERFRQADSTSTRQYGGLGLGLAIVRHLVELHGGRARVSSPGENLGATFTVELPLIAPSIESTAPEERALLPADETLAEFDGGHMLDGLRVLVVDDEQDARELVSTILEQQGATVTTVRSAAEALETLTLIQPDVIISDIEMPNEDGYALIKKIRELEPQEGGRTPAAALTAYARTEDRMRALLAGFQIHLPKPVEPAELIAVVANLAERTGSQLKQGSAGEEQHDEG
ncbi:MAG TPA: PAS domain S-box protein [Pyrinomonadaceae bacterium]|jgi:PAS domain S-box-containing protein